MDINKGDIVRSIAGRDKTKLFFVTSLDDGGYLNLVDGRIRHVDNQKRKKLKHVQFYSSSDSRVRDKILSNESITDAEVRKAIKVLTVNTKEELIDA